MQNPNHNQPMYMENPNLFLTKYKKGQINRLVLGYQLQKQYESGSTAYCKDKKYVIHVLAWDKFGFFKICEEIGQKARKLYQMPNPDLKYKVLPDYVLNQLIADMDIVLSYRSFNAHIETERILQK